MQARAGVRPSIERIEKRLFRDFMPDQHRTFFARLPYLIVGSRDTNLDLMASMIAGPPGFVSSPDPQTLRVDHAPLPGDRSVKNLVKGAPVAVLGIEFHTRRRNRLNGTILESDDAGFTVRVKQSFGNCPKYIQARDAEFVADVAKTVTPPLLLGAWLPERAANLVTGCDTFFIASSSARPGETDAAEGLDVSHRGGKPGFVRVRGREGGHELAWPDFAGNSFFNTLGNLQENPRAGLLFVNFETGDLLSLTGQVAVVWSDPELDSFQGAERLLRFTVLRGFFLERVVPLRWSAVRFSPELLETGSWESQ